MSGRIHSTRALLIFLVVFLRLVNCLLGLVPTSEHELLEHHHRRLKQQVQYDRQDDGDGEVAQVVVPLRINA